MLDFSWSEIALIAVVALIVIGPKDLPRALRTAGQWIRKARSISREFQSSIEQMIREAELDEVKQQIDKARNFDIGREIEKVVDPGGTISEALKPPELPHIGALMAGTEGSAAAAPPSATAEGGPEGASHPEHTADASPVAPAVLPPGSAPPAPSVLPAREPAPAVAREDSVREEGRREEGGPRPPA